MMRELLAGETIGTASQRLYVRGHDYSMPYMCIASRRLLLLLLSVAQWQST
jgi:hypothetical protein